MKRIVSIENISELSLKNGQLLIYRKDDTSSVPIEDMEMLIVDSSSSMTIPLIRALGDNVVPTVICDERHLPSSLILPLEGHFRQTAIISAQLTCPEAREKRLWREIIRSKIQNQASVLLKKNLDADKLLEWANSDEPESLEGAAAAYYFKTLFGKEFIRERFGDDTNTMLNYGYTILRSVISKSIIEAGLFLGKGISHHNQFDAFVFADDLIEPFRPFVDETVHSLRTQGHTKLTSEIRHELQQIPYGQMLILGTTRTVSDIARIISHSVAQYFMGETDTIPFPSA